MGKLGSILKVLGVNAAMLAASLFFTLLVCELFLRFLFPRYEYAAEAQRASDTLRIWARVANTREMRAHPDTGVEHPVYHNNLALRQHRDITPEAVAETTTVAFFGDSFTENPRLPSHHSFNEPLDYLLNQSGQPFTVLNFGVDGYGTDQAYLTYQAFPQAKALDYVFYIFSSNDLRNIYENHLYTLDEAGALVKTVSAPPPPLWLRLASRLHLTYLLLDVRQRLAGTESAAPYGALLGEETEAQAEQLSEAYQERFHSPRANAISDDLHEGEANQELEQSVAILRGLLSQWRQQVEANGGKFYVVVLPLNRESEVQGILGDGVPIVNLYELFKADIEQFDDATVRFQNDGHWNEPGNLLAARHLYRLLETEAALPPMSEAEVQEALFTYYAAFPDGWLPPPSLLPPTPTEPQRLAAIRQKYLALELEATR